MTAFSGSPRFDNTLIGPSVTAPTNEGMAKAKLSESARKTLVILIPAMGHCCSDDMGLAS
jgi:hypothetical protein